MGVGILVFVVGALLTFAVEYNVPDINLGVAGLILMVAGRGVAQLITGSAWQMR